MTDTEKQVREIIEAGRIEVVVFWAAWCGNSISQLERGLAEAIRHHDEVGFSFVSLWDEGRDGLDTLRAYGIPERARVFGQPGVGQDDPKEARRKDFLGLPVTWIPTTWVFRDGALAYAFNYGEVSRQQLDAAIEGVTSSW